MKKTIICSNALMLLLIAAGNAFAAPGSGFGLNAGMTSNRMSGTTSPAGTAYSYSSSGLSVGMDYQFALSDSFSINPLLMSSSEDPTGTTLQPGTAAGHVMLGLQLRYWIDDFFIGGHVAKYGEVLSTTSVNAGTTTTTDTVGDGIGRGLVVGWAPSKSKWFLMGQIDTANIGYTNANVKLTGTRVSIGYRWK